MDLQNELKKVKALAKTKGMKEEEAEKIFFQLINMFNADNYETVGQWKKTLIDARDFMLARDSSSSYLINLLSSKIENCERISEDTLIKDISNGNVVN